MNAVRTLRVALCGALALAVGAPAAHALLPPAAAHPWVEVRTPRFRVCTDADAAVALQAARHLERLADVLHLWTGLRVDGGWETHVYVFRDLEGFKPYRPFGDDDEGGVTAGFHASGDGVEHIAFHVPERGGLAMRFASHEYLHAVLARNLGELPLWVNEGLAEFYSTFEARRQSAVVGRYLPEHVAQLSQGLFPMDGLMLVSNDSPAYREGRARATFYAQSWAVLHMLMLDDERSRVADLLAALRGGTSGEAALRLAYGPNAADSLQHRLREYLKQNTLPARELRFDRPFDDARARTRGLGPTETLTLLGELLSHTAQGALAGEHLEAAWRADTTRALPAALLGRRAERDGDHAASARWIEAATRAGDDDPRALGIAGTALAGRRLLARRALRWPAEGADADARRGRALLARALEGRPDAVEWLVPYAETFLDDSAGVEDGIGALLRAQEYAPLREDGEGTLAVLNLRAGNRSAAVAAYRRIPKGPNRAFWRELSGRLIERQTVSESRRLARAGRAAEAESLLVRLPRLVLEPGVAADCEQELLSLRSRAAPSPADPAGGAVARSGAPGAEPRVTAATPPPRPTRAHLDSLAADARNQKRMRSAEALLRSGSPGLACALYDMILADRPSARLRREVGSLKARYCGRRD